MYTSKILMIDNCAECCVWLSKPCDLIINCRRGLKLCKRAAGLSGHKTKHGRHPWAFDPRANLPPAGEAV